MDPVWLPISTCALQKSAMRSLGWWAPPTLRRRLYKRGRGCSPAVHPQTSLRPEHTWRAVCTRWVSSPSILIIFMCHLKEHPPFWREFSLWWNPQFLTFVVCIKLWYFSAFYATYGNIYPCNYYSENVFRIYQHLVVIQLTFKGYLPLGWIELKIKTDITHLILKM